MTRLFFALRRAKSAPSSVPPDTSIMFSRDMIAVQKLYGAVLVVSGSEVVVLSRQRQLTMGFRWALCCVQEMSIWQLLHCYAIQSTLLAFEDASQQMRILPAFTSSLLAL